MSCPHTDTTAILAAFGEAPSDFEAHLSSCSACRQVVSEHLHTLSVIEPVTSTRPGAVQRQMNRHALGFLIAAAALLAVQFMPTQAEPEDLSTIHTQTTITADDMFSEPIDNELASLEMEIALFNLEET